VQRLARPAPAPQRRRRTVALLLPALLSLAAALPGCLRSNPERELRDTIAKMAHAIEVREPGDFLAHLSDDFTRDSGAFGKHEARRMLAGILLRNEKIALTTVVTHLVLQGERAQATLRVVATGGSGGLLPERGQTWEFDTAWRREGGEWKVFNAEWREGL
jgi:hypothetical protein